MYICILVMVLDSIFHFKGGRSCLVWFDVAYTHCKMESLPTEIPNFSWTNINGKCVWRKRYWANSACWCLLVGRLDLSLGSANVLFSCIRICQLKICCTGKSTGQFGNTESLYVTEIKSLQLNCVRTVGSQASNWRAISLPLMTRIYRKLSYSAVGWVFFFVGFFFSAFWWNYAILPYEAYDPQWNWSSNHRILYQSLLETLMCQASKWQSVPEELRVALPPV